MKLSVESKVAIAVATGFVVLTVGVIAQGQSEGGTGEPNGYGPANNPALSQMSSEGLQNSDFGRTTAEDARNKFPGDTTQTTITTKGKTKKALKSAKHRSGHAQ
jgi:hypothetical protein